MQRQGVSRVASGRRDMHTVELGVEEAWHHSSILLAVLARPQSNSECGDNPFLQQEDFRLGNYYGGAASTCLPLEVFTGTKSPPEKEQTR